MIKRFFLVMIMLALVPACQGRITKGESGIRPFAAHNAMNAGLFESPTIIIHNERPLYTFYDDKNRLMISDGDGLNWVSKGSPDPSLLSYNRPLSDGKYIYNVWRPKISKGGNDVGAKHVFFNASYDDGATFSEPVMLNKEAKAIEPKIAASGNGDVYVVWSDERNSKFDLYMNVSHDYGRTWPEGEIRVDTNTAPGESQSIDFVIFPTGSSVRIFWVDNINKSTKLMMKLSRDSGKTWDEPVSIIEDKGGIYDPKVMNVNGRILVLWSGISKTDTKRAKWTLYGLYSDDGEKWQAIPGFEFNSAIAFEISEAFDSKGNIYVAMALKKTVKKGIFDIYFISSPDRGQTWSDLKRITTNTPEHTYSVLPTIAADDAGNVVIVWLDYRNIRGNLYMNVSKDFGKSWLEKDIRLSDAASNANLPDLASDGKGDFYAAWLALNDDKMKDGYAMLSRLPVETAGSSNPAEVKPDEKRLKERVSEFWNARIKGDFASNYDQMDPHFRAAILKIKYVANMVSDIVFHEYNIENVEITENIAKVKIKYSFEIKESVLMGQKINVPKRDDVLVQDWIWIDGDWYKVQKQPGTKMAYMPYYPAFPQ